MFLIHVAGLPLTTPTSVKASAHRLHHHCPIICRLLNLTVISISSRFCPASIKLVSPQPCTVTPGHIIGAILRTEVYLATFRPWNIENL